MQKYDDDNNNTNFLAFSHAFQKSMVFGYKKKDHTIHCLKEFIVADASCFFLSAGFT